MKLLFDKRDAILADISSVNERMSILEAEHKERIIQLHELRGAQRVVDALLSEAEAAGLKELSKNEKGKVEFKVGDEVFYLGEKTRIVADSSSGLVVEYGAGWPGSAGEPDVSGLDANKFYHFADPEELEHV